MPRTVPALLAAHLALPTTTTCYLLRVKPIVGSAALFGITTGNIDVTYDDGSGDGPIVYGCPTGYTPFDLDSHADLSVDNTEASALLASIALQGMTAEGIARGDYDCARFVQYLVNYEDLTMGHVVINSGQVGQVTNLNDQTVSIELRSLTQILKQNNIIELTSITDRAAYGDTRNKLPLRWYNGTVASTGAENDRDFVSSTIPGFAEAPGATTATISGVTFFTGDGVKMLGNLVDTAGQQVPPGFVVTGIKLDGTTLSTPLNYSVDPAGIVRFVVVPVSGATGTWDGSIPVYPDGYFVPGVVHWLTGANAGRENEIEEYVTATGAITLSIPTRDPIAAGDQFKIRKDTDGSKSRAIVDGNLPNFRGEPELPRADGTGLQSPTPSPA